MNMDIKTTSAESILEKIADARVVYPTTINGLHGMTSLEIAEITGKRHGNVIRDIRKMLEEIGSNLSQCQYVETQTPDSYGRLQLLIVMDKELTFTLLSRYSFKLTHLIVKRWMELEGSGFARVSVQDSVVQLVEREKDIRNEVLRQFKSKLQRKLSLHEKEIKKWERQAARERAKDRKAGRYAE